MTDVANACARHWYAAFYYRPFGGVADAASFVSPLRASDWLPYLHTYTHLRMVLTALATLCLGLKCRYLEEQDTAANKSKPPTTATLMPKCSLAALPILG